MRPVALQELKQLGDGKHWSVEQQLSELDSIGPVKGWLKALHRGDDLWLEAEATATVELICDRCLKSYPQPLEARVSESIALQSGGPDAELEELDGSRYDTAPAAANAALAAAAAASSGCSCRKTSSARPRKRGKRGCARWSLCACLSSASY